MKKELLDYIVCPSCGSPFDCQDKKRENEEIIEGILKCNKCKRIFPIKESIPQILPSFLSKEVKRTSKLFDYEWQRFPKLTNVYQKQFLDWIYPIQPDFFNNKIVLDAGCGKGRHLYWSAKFGAKIVIGIDVGESVKTAYQNTKNLPNVHVLQADISCLPFRNIFDYIYCIGVLHHLPNPRSGLGCLVNCLKKGGTVSIWVYAKEGNKWILNFIDPLRRRVAARIFPSLLEFFSFPLSVILFLSLKLIYKSNNRILRIKPFYKEYLNYISGFSFEEIRWIVFDHLGPQLAHYIPHEEIENWFKENNLKNISISFHNRNSWRALGWRE